MNKKKYYSQKHIVKNYNHYRFGGKSGKFVNNKELSYFLDQINKYKINKILDVPCGTGRFISQLGTKFKVTGVDTSPAMINICQSKFPQSKFTKANINKLPFENNYFDCVLSLRLFHHYPIKKIKPMIKEIMRVLKKNGIIMFDTHNRSPKQLVKYFFPKSIQRVYLHQDKQISALSKRLELKIIGKKKAFLLTPHVCRYLPLCMVKLLDRSEKSLPSYLHTRTFWILQKND